MAELRRREPAPSIERIGSARRAWVSVRNASVVFAPLWIGSLLLGPRPPTATGPTSRGWRSESSSTSSRSCSCCRCSPSRLGRWIDKRTWRSTRTAVLTFGYYGLAWGVVAVGLYGLGRQREHRAAAVAADSRDRGGGGAAAARRSQRRWTIISWVLYVLAMLPVHLRAGDPADRRVQPRRSNFPSKSPPVVVPRLASPRRRSRCLASARRWRSPRRGLVMSTTAGDRAVTTTSAADAQAHRRVAPPARFSRGERPPPQWCSCGLGWRLPLRWRTPLATTWTTSGGSS